MDCPTGVSSFQYLVDKTAAAPSVSGTVISGSTFNLTSLTASTSYYLHLRSACSSGSYSSWVNIPFTTASASGCNAPVVTTTPGANNVTLSWPLVTGATGYEYAVTTSSAPPASGTATTATSVTSSGLSKGGYYAHVRTKCSNTFSPWNTKQFSTAITSVSATSGILKPLTIAPNPAADFINLEARISGLVRIVDVSGRTMKEFTLKSTSHRINVADLPSGFYFVQFQNADLVDMQTLQKL